MSPRGAAIPCVTPRRAGPVPGHRGQSPQRGSATGSRTGPTLVETVTSALAPFARSRLLLCDDDDSCPVRVPRSSSTTAALALTRFCGSKSVVEARSTQGPVHDGLRRRPEEPRIRRVTRRSSSSRIDGVGRERPPLTPSARGDAAAALLGGSEGKLIPAAAYLDDTLLSTLPSTTMAAWVTAFTGVGPAYHGGHGQRVLHPRGTPLRMRRRRSRSPTSIRPSAIHTDQYLNRLCGVARPVYERMRMRGPERPRVGRHAGILRRAPIALLAPRPDRHRGGCRGLRRGGAPEARVTRRSRAWRTEARRADAPASSRARSTPGRCPMCSRSISRCTRSLRARLPRSAAGRRASRRTCARWSIPRSESWPSKLRCARRPRSGSRLRRWVTRRITATHRSCTTRRTRSPSKDQGTPPAAPARRLPGAALQDQGLAEGGRLPGRCSPTRASMA